MVKKEDQKLVAGISSNYDGNGSLSYLKEHSLALFEIASVGYARCVQTISLDRNYLIHVELVPGPIERIKGGEVWTWKINKLNDAEIVIGGKGKKTVYSKKNSN